MKRKFSYVLSTIILAMTTTGCGYKPAKKVSLVNIGLVCIAYKSYVVGDYLMDIVNTKIDMIGYYSNGTNKPLYFQDVQFSLTSGGNNFDPFAPLPNSGSYSLRARKDNVNSNAYNFTVVDGHVYVSSIEYNGPSLIGIERSQQFSLTVNPSNHTEQVLFTSTNESVATVSQTGINQFEIVGHQTGSTVLSFSARASASDTDYIQIFRSVSVEDNYVTSITPAGPNTVGKGASIQVSLDVQPLDFTTEVIATSGNLAIATVNKVDDKLFNIVGVAAGTTSITFSAKKNESEYVSVPFSVAVQDIAKTKIQQTYKEFNKKNIWKVSGCPATGDAKLLLIPIWFNDSGSFIDESKKSTIVEDIEYAFFGSQEQTGWHSVSSFYKEESKQKLNLTGTVSDWYEPNKNASYYASDTETVNTTLLTVNAVNWYFNNHSSDSRTNYDSDGDGFLDGVMLIYAAPDYITYKNKSTGYGADKENLWAYVSYVTILPSSVSNPNPNVFMWASYDFMYSDTLAKTKTGHNFGYGDTSHCSLDAHTYIHEMGHVFGLEDYYDYAGEVSYAGRFSMQDYNVCGHDGFSALALGWADPYIPTKSDEIVLNDFQSSHELILLTPEWNTYNSAFDEYLLLELYSPTGLNAQDVTYNYKRTGTAPNAVGVKLWHVDAKLFKASGNSGTFTSDTNLGNINNAFNNTSKTKAEGGRDCYAKPVSTYQDYSMLHLIRNNVLETYQSNNSFKAADLFYADNTFTIETYQSQFLKGTKLDFNQNLGWTFTVNEIIDYGTGQYSARITLTKTA